MTQAAERPPNLLEDAPLIAAECQRSFRGDPARLLTCASRATEAYILALKAENPDTEIVCRHRELTANAIIDNLSVPGLQRNWRLVLWGMWEI